jgi:hypothetical protein
MFFEGDEKVKKMNLATKKIIKKEDFLKKIEESKKPEEKPKKDQSYSIITKFVKKM